MAAAFATLLDVARQKRHFEVVSHLKGTLTDVSALQHLLEQGVRYIDVRSRQEYAAGHIPGALNVPWMHGTVAGLVPNQDFEAEAQRQLASGEAVIVGCRTCNRARAAAAVLDRLGFEHWVDGLGFEGTRDAFGRLNPGWSRLGLPVLKGPAPR